MMYAVAFTVDEIFDRIDFFGPFEEFEDAVAWASSAPRRCQCGCDPWSVVQLAQPEYN